MSDAEPRKQMLPEWALVLLALGGVGTGASALGFQQTAIPAVTHAELAEKVDREDLERVFVSTDHSRRAAHHEERYSRG